MPPGYNPDATPEKLRDIAVDARLRQLEMELSAVREPTKFNSSAAASGGAAQAASDTDAKSPPLPRRRGNLRLTVDDFQIRMLKGHALHTDSRYADVTQGVHNHPE